MGRKKFQRRNKRDRDNGSGKDANGFRSDGRLIVKDNELMTKYYKLQNIFHGPEGPEAEFEKFMETMRKPLPTTWRFTRFGTESVRKWLQENVFNKLEGEHKPKPMDWYGEKDIAWYWPIGRSELRKDPSLSAFHEQLVLAGDSGRITRQEAVSMVPPLFLNVQSHHRVLDLCAAPGSKTSQLVEMLYSNQEDAQAGRPLANGGFVVANDLSEKRAALMTHQLQRLQHHYPSVVVTNHDATLYPLLRVPKVDHLDANDPIRKFVETSSLITDEDRASGELQFDRVLCDVMCSGDGTVRKSPDMWVKWNPMNAISLHNMQIKVTMRGLRLCRVGGLVVYSTCSLSPVEDEAVLLEIIRQCEGAVELVDVSDQYPGLKRENGLHTWTMMGKDGVVYDSLEAMHEQYRNVCSSMLPDPEFAKKVHIERSMRFLPHAQDTGGFFVAVLRKVDKLPEEKQGLAFQEEHVADAREMSLNFEEASATLNSRLDEAREALRQDRPQSEDASADGEGDEPAKKRKRVDLSQVGTTVSQQWYLPQTTSYVSDRQDLQDGNFVPLPEALKKEIGDFYGLSGESVLDGLYSRTNVEHTLTDGTVVTLPKRIYFSETTLVELMKLNCLNMMCTCSKNGKFVFSRPRWRVINMGIRAFAHHDVDVTRDGMPMRMCHDSAAVFASLMKVRSFTGMNHRDTSILLEKMALRVDEFETPGLGAGLAALPSGAVVITANNVLGDPMKIVAWKVGVTIKLMIPKEEMKGLRYFLDPAAMYEAAQQRSAERIRAKEAAAAEANASAANANPGGDAEMTES